MQFLRPSDKTISRDNLTNSDHVLKYGLPYFDAAENAIVIGDGETAIASLKPIGLTILTSKQTFKPNATVTLKAGSNVELRASESESGATITIISSYSNTTYSAGNGLSLLGTAFNLKQATKNELGGIKLCVDNEDYDGSLITFITN